MERLLKDYLVRHTDDGGVSYTATCMVCGRIWKSAAVKNSGLSEEEARDNAAKDVSGVFRVCGFCGRPVCGDCFEDVDGILLCVQCGSDLRRRLEEK